MLEKDEEWAVKEELFKQFLFYFITIKGWDGQGEEPTELPTSVVCRTICKIRAM